MNDNSATIAGRAFPSQWVNCPAPFLEGREQVVDRLLYDLFHHQRIQLLSGPSGAGKTIALRRLEKRLRGRLLTLCVDAADIADQRALLQLISDACERHLDAHSNTHSNTVAATPTDRIEAIHSRLQQLADDGQRLVLLVDNAEQLDDDSVDSLLQLARTDQPSTAATTAASSMLSVVMACLPEFSHQHADRRHWQPLPLRPLTIVGTGRYLQARLCRAGIRGHGPFNRAAVEQLHAQSGGWPGRIDQQARDTLGDSSHNLLNTEITLGRPSATLVVLFLLVILAAAGWWYRQPLRDLATDAGINLNLPSSFINPISSGDQPAPPEPASEPTLDPATTERPASSGSIIGTDGDSRDPQRAIEQPPSNDQPVETPAAVPSVAPATKPPASKDQPTAPVQSDKQRGAALALAPATTPAPASPPPAKPAATPAQQPTAAPVSTLAAKPAAKPALNSAIIRLQGWIEQQAPQRWTLQVFTAHSESHLLNLVTRSGIPGSWAYYHIRQNGKDWYTLLYGSFGSREAATQASGPLKPLFGQPLLRNFASIHKSLGISR